MPLTTGYDLQALGIPPGPVYRQVLSRLRDAWLDGEVSTADQEQNLLHTLLVDHGISGHD